jgi:hypothetical protein
MFRSLYAFFFGCFHTRTTFPMTVTTYSPHDGEAHQRTYVACLHCGEELAYNWQKMRIEGRSRILDIPSMAAPVVPIRSEKTRIYQRLLRPESSTLRRAEAGR